MCEHLDLINRTHLSAVNVCWSLCPGDSAMSHGESQSALAANQRLLSTCSPHAPQQHTLTSRPTSNTKSPSDAAGTAVITTPPSARRVAPASVSDSCRRFVRRWRQRFSETFSTLFFFGWQPFKKINHRPVATCGSPGDMERDAFRFLRRERTSRHVRVCKWDSSERRAVC